MNALLIRLIVLIAIFASIFIISQFLIGAIWERRTERNAINRRLSLLRSGVDREAVSVTLLKNAPPVISSRSGILERLHARFVRMVMMSAVPIDVRAFVWLACVGFVAVFGLIAFLAWLGQFSLSVGVIGLILVASVAIAFGIPLVVIGRLADKQRKRMEEQFPVALDIFTRSLRAGHPVASAIQLVTEEMGDPIGSEFGLASDEVAYGADLTDALLAMAERWDLEDMRMFVVSVSIQKETGGNLAEILENLSRVIRERASMLMTVRALSSEGRMTGWMLTILPILTFVAVFLASPRFYLDVAGDPIFLIGFPSLILLYIVGFISIRRLVDLKV